MCKHFFQRPTASKLPNLVLLSLTLLVHNLQIVNYKETSRTCPARARPDVPTGEDIDSPGTLLFVSANLPSDVRSTQEREKAFDPLYARLPSSDR